MKTAEAHKMVTTRVPTYLGIKVWATVNYLSNDVDYEPPTFRDDGYCHVSIDDFDIFDLELELPYGFDWLSSHLIKWGWVKALAYRVIETHAEQFYGTDEFDLEVDWSYNH